MKRWITHYEISYPSQGLPKVIYCWWWIPNEKTLLSGKLVFHNDGVPLPDDGPDSVTFFGQDDDNTYDTYCLHYHVESFPHVVDLIRNEDPTYVAWDEKGIENGVYVWFERSGEGEE